MLAQKLRLSIEEVDAIVSRLVQSEWIAYDLESRVLYIRGHFDCRGNFFRNEESVISALRQLEELPDSRVFLDVAKELATMRLGPKVQPCVHRLICRLRERAGEWPDGGGPDRAQTETGQLFDASLNDPLNDPLNDALNTPLNSRSLLNSRSPTLSPYPKPLPNPPLPPQPGQGGGEGGAQAPEEGGGEFRCRLGSGKGKLMSELADNDLQWYATKCRATDHHDAALIEQRRRERARSRPTDQRTPDERYHEDIVDPATRPQPGTPEYQQMVQQIRRNKGLDKVPAISTS